MKLVIIESPCSGDKERNAAYARACVRDSHARGEAPYASHLFTEVGLAWFGKADLRAVYTDLGISPSMIEGALRSVESGVPVEPRSLGGEWLEGG